MTELVERSGLPERTFKRRFTSATGYSPIAYVQHVRVEEAKRRLERTSEPVDAISYAVGYEDPASFRRLFKRITGVTPGALPAQAPAPRLRAHPVAPHLSEHDAVRSVALGGERRTAWRARRSRATRRRDPSGRSARCRLGHAREPLLVGDARRGDGVFHDDDALPRVQEAERRLGAAQTSVPDRRRRQFPRSWRETSARISGDAERSKTGFACLTPPAPMASLTGEAVSPLSAGSLLRYDDRHAEPFRKPAQPANPIDDG